MRTGTRLTMGSGLVVAASVKESLAAEMEAIALLQAGAMRYVGLHPDIRSMQADEDRARKLGKDFTLVEEATAAATIRREHALPAAEGEEWKES